MTAIVFAGPTISHTDAARELAADYRPPVAQGDLYLAARQGPQVIGIIDGYFDNVPAVWHKEILWAMTRGIHVFGSASMGALRAAELSAFGMEGVGAIYEAFHRGALTDDDEVAVAHGTAELGFRGQSEALVNIRATLERAAATHVITPDTGARLERIAKELFYPQRAYPLILQLGAAAGVSTEQLSALQAWLPAGQVNQKRDDAVAMLRVMRERLNAGLEPKMVSFSFEHTWFWEQARVAADAAHHAAEGDCLDLERVLDEIRLEGWYAHALEGARARYLAVEEARRRGMRVSPEMLQETADAFRRERGLIEPEETRRWLQENDLSGDQVGRFMEEEALLRWTRRATAHETTARLLDHLRSTGEYARLVTRAQHKQQALKDVGLLQATLTNVGLTEEELIRWYFKDRLGRSPEADVSLYAVRAGFTDVDAFLRAVMSEYCYCRDHARHCCSRREDSG